MLLERRVVGVARQRRGRRVVGVQLCRVDAPRPRHACADLAAAQVAAPPMVRT